MKLTIERAALVVLMFVLIVFIAKDCSRPSEEREADRKEQYETEVTILKAEKTSIQAAQDSIAKVLIHRTRKDSLSLSRYYEQISTLKKKVVIKRIYVQPLIDSIPTLRAFVELQDSVIQYQETRIDSLNAALDFHAKVNQDLIALEFVEDKIESQMAIETSLRISDLEQQGRRKEKKNRFVKVLLPIVGVAGLLIGSAL